MEWVTCNKLTGDKSCNRTNGTNQGVCIYFMHLPTYPGALGVCVSLDKVKRLLPGQNDCKNNLFLGQAY